MSLPTFTPVDNSGNVIMGEVSVFDNFGPISASGQISIVPVKMSGFICCQSSNGVITFWDSLSNSGSKIFDSIPVVAGQFYSVPNGLIQTNIGLYLELVSGSCVITPVFI